MEEEIEKQQHPEPEDATQSESQSQQPSLLENPLHVKQAVDTNLLTELRDEFGFKELRAEKALYYTKNVGLEEAIQWIADHEQDDSIDKPISTCISLTKEEAERKAFELQQHVRKHRAEQEKVEEIEKERKRMEMGKNMLETQRAIEEASRKQLITQIAREKEQQKTEKQRLLELMKRDYEERFGKPYPEDKRKPEEADVSKKSKKDQCVYWIARLKARADDTNKESLISCMKTLAAYIHNAHDNPTEAKYHRIKKDNKAFVAKVMPFAPESLECLHAVL